MTAIEIDLRPVGPQHFEARLRGRSRVICVSPRPLIDSARLLAQYAINDPDVELVAYHEGARNWCMRGNLRALAWTSVNERKKREIREEKRRASSWG